MAKKFALVTGLYNIFTTRNIIVNDVEVQSYNINNITPNGLVDKNTVGFYYAEGEDIGRYIGEHKITDKDRFIITQGDVFSLFGSPEIETETPEIVENTWRPILINGDYVIDTQYEDGNGNYVTPEEPFSINYNDGNLTTIESTYDAVGNFLSMRYNIDDAELINFIKENISELAPEVGDGKLSFEFDKTTVHTENDIKITNPNYDEEDPTSSPTITTHDVDIDQNTLSIEGDFTANSIDDSVVKIKYKGTADRVDWYVENDSRDDKDTNNSTAKKYLYIECLQEYFKPSADYPFLEVKNPDLISQDSIVFITCGSIVTETINGPQISYDADVFDNPEYVDGARFIWTQNMMFSANTWMPIFTRENETSELFGISPIMGKNPNGSKLIIQGAGGIKVITQPNDTNGKHERVITIDGSGISRGSGEGSVFSLEDGIATDVKDTDEGRRVDVKVESNDTSNVYTYEPTVEGTITEKPNKNFIHIKTNPENPNDSWLEVNGIDSKSIIIEEDIKIGGTPVGDLVIESGRFNDVGNYVRKGMNLHEVLVRILCDENSGGPTLPTIEYVLRAIESNVEIEVYYYDEDAVDFKGEQITEDNITQIPGKQIIVFIQKTGNSEQYLELSDFYPNYTKIENGETETVSFKTTSERIEMTPSTENTLYNTDNSFSSSENLSYNDEKQYVIITIPEIVGENVFECNNTTTPVSEDVNYIIEKTVINDNNETETYRFNINEEEFSAVTKNSQKTFTINVPAEDFGNITENPILEIEESNIIITASDIDDNSIVNNSSLPLGTKIKFVNEARLTSRQGLTIDGFVTDFEGGYIYNNEKIKSNTFVKSDFTPENNIGAPNETSSVFTKDGDYYIVSGNTQNVYSVSREFTVNSNLDSFEIIPVSNWGNSGTPIVISNDLFESKTITKTATFTVNPLIYDYIYYSNPDANITDFDNVDIDELISNSAVTEVIDDSEYKEIYVNFTKNPMCSQFIGIIQGEYSNIDFVNLNGNTLINEAATITPIIKDYYGITYTVTIITRETEWGQNTKGYIRFYK